MKPVARPAGIAGETLVGLMVGMALSLLTVALTLFHLFVVFAYK